MCTLTTNKLDGSTPEVWCMQSVLECSVFLLILTPSYVCVLFRKILMFLEEEVPDAAETLSRCSYSPFKENGGHMQKFFPT